MFCPKCGQKLRDGANFCPSCGNQLNFRAVSGINEITLRNEDSIIEAEIAGVSESNETAGANPFTNQQPIIKAPYWLLIALDLFFIFVVASPAWFTIGTSYAYEELNLFSAASALNQIAGTINSFSSDVDTGEITVLAGIFTVCGAASIAAMGFDLYKDFTGKKTTGRESAVISVSAIVGYVIIASVARELAEFTSLDSVAGLYNLTDFFWIAIAAPAFQIVVRAFFYLANHVD